MHHRLLWSALLLVALALGVAAFGRAHAQQRGFSNASIHGSYGISYIVALPNISGPTQFLSGTGVIQADGKGQLTGEETTNTNGQVCSGKLTGNYTVSPNGTGTVSAVFTATTPGCSDVSIEQTLVIMDSGRVVRVSDTMSTEVTIFEEWQRQM